MREVPGDSIATERADPAAKQTNPWSDARIWIMLTFVGLVLSYMAVRLDARLGTASAPFLGRYRLQVGPGSLLAPAVATAVLTVAVRGWLDRWSWRSVQIFGYGTSLAWALALALVDGASGLTRALGSPEEYLPDLVRLNVDPIQFLRDFTHDPQSHTDATRGHPPGPLLLLWALTRLGVTNHVTLGLLITAAGALTVPMVLSAVRDSAGETAARRYVPVLALAPYAVWVAVSLDAIVALLGAAAVVAGCRASRRQVRGWPATGWALLAGVLIGVAALFSYAAPWLGLSVVLVYFARRRPSFNILTGIGLIIPIGAAQAAGFAWVDGLLVAEMDYGSRIAPYRSMLWWSAISLVALLLAAGPALVASARKMRNTPAWPFLVGAATAVAFSVVAGLARGGVEHAWLPFFPWLTVAAVAPERPAGPPAPGPLLLVGIGAGVAIVVEAILATPW
jgi:hypothetical protein